MSPRKRRENHYLNTSKKNGDEQKPVNAFVINYFLNFQTVPFAVSSKRMSRAFNVSLILSLTA